LQEGAGVNEKSPLNVPGSRISLQVHPEDNVVTLLDNNTACHCLADGTTIAPDIPFGHKVALCAIEVGAPIIKYGVSIGLATTAIGKGEHVHVHNLA